MMEMCFCVSWLKRWFLLILGWFMIVMVCVINLKVVDVINVKGVKEEFFFLCLFGV